MFAVDTNVLLYAANTSCDEHATCRAKLQSWRRSALPWCTTWNVLYEFVRVVTHARILPRPWTGPAAMDFVQALVATPSLSILTHTPRHVATARLTLSEYPDLAGSILHDAHTAILLREHGVERIVTRDRDFRRFSFLRVEDPLA